ncbi:MAG: FAD binding domain-containing protein [Chitinophagaceae bacterium]
MIQFILNNETVSTNAPPGTLLIDFIRYQSRLTGTKIGCREGDCGACTVLAGTVQNGALQYSSLTSCLTPLGNIDQQHIVTVEGLNPATGLTPVQQAMADESATQCGFCTPGFVVSMTGFCLSTKPASYEAAVAAVDGNICRCTGYKSIERSLKTVVAVMQQKPADKKLFDFLTANEIIPAYFKNMEQRLTQLASATNGSAKDLVVSTWLGGGTDLYVQQHEKMVHSDINFLLNNGSLKGIRQEGRQCIIGASATVTELMESGVFQAAVPGFNNFAKLVSSTPIRNIATLAGNFSNASPIGDLTVLFLALDAVLQLRSGDNTRQVNLRDFFLAYKKTAATKEEFIEKILFDIPARQYFINFEKVSKRRNLDIATVNTAIKIEMENDVIKSATLSAGGVAPVPFFLQNAAVLLKGKRMGESLVEEVINAARNEVRPISDARGTADYKRQLLGQLIKAHFIVLFPALDVKQLLRIA